jgi:O-succinylbenzoate synthase
MKINFVSYLKHKEFYFLGYNAVQSFEIQPTFGGTCHLHLQGLKISEVRNGLHAVISQKIEDS